MKYNIEFYYRPGDYFTDKGLQKLVTQLRNVAKTCFDDLPQYQCLLGTREEMSSVVLAVAKTAQGEIVGFCSSLLLQVENIGDVLHLGLTCVSPLHRGQKLTHLLSHKILVRYLLRYRPFSRVWITNVACVLSSLGNVALHFENVYPSPFTMPVITKEYVNIAQAVDKKYRDKIHIDDDAKFDSENFVFRKSVKNSIFQKKENDSRYLHRNPIINQYYSRLMCFEQGDEVLQVGYISLATAFKYQLKKLFPKIQKAHLAIAQMS